MRYDANNVNNYHSYKMDINYDIKTEDNEACNITPNES